jgi:hypothetical protein
MAGRAVQLRQQQEAAVHHMLIRILIEVELIEVEDVGVVDRLRLQRMRPRWRVEEKGRQSSAMTNSEWRMTNEDEARMTNEGMTSDLRALGLIRHSEFDFAIC